MAITTQPAPAIEPRAAAPPRRRRMLDRLGVWVFRLAALGLIGLNAWWLVRDRRPAPDLKALRGMLGSRRFPEAEAGLRERLRRSRHDDDARMLLARALAGQERMLDCARELHRVPSWSP